MIWGGHTLHFSVKRYSIENSYRTIADLFKTMNINCSEIFLFFFIFVTYVHNYINWW